MSEAVRRQALSRIDVSVFPEVVKPFLRDTSRAGLLQLVDRLHSEIPARVPLNSDEAAEMAEAMRFIAAQLHDQVCHALADWAAGYVAHARADYVGALGFFEAAVARFEVLGRDADVARTLNGALPTLVMLERYEQAKIWAQRTRAIFARSGDGLSVARLESHLGNLLHRSDLYEEARQHYKQAHELFVLLGESRDVAAALTNLAGSAASIGDFGTALAEYRAARGVCASNNMSRLVAENDYNIAYLHFLKGDYLSAIDLYRTARTHSRQTGDAYHVTLCDLDQAEVYLDLNLLSEGLQLAERAARGFFRLRKKYEHARALTLMGIAYQRLLRNDQAFRVLSRAKRATADAANPALPATIDLYRAACLRGLGLMSASLRVSRHARRAFAAARLYGRMAQCDVVAGQLYLEAGKLEEAFACARSALQLLDTEDTGVVTFQALVLRAQIERAAGNLDKVEETLRSAIDRLENLRTRFAQYELSSGLIQDKTQVYEMLVELIQSSPAAHFRTAETFALIERAKSQTLSESMAKVHQDLSSRGGEAPGEVSAIRQHLNAQYHRLERMITSPEAPDKRSFQALRKRIRDSESRLLRMLVLEQARNSASEVVQQDGTVSLEDIQAMIPADCTILEYYVTSSVVFAAVIGKETLHLQRLGPVSPVKHSLELMKFHFYRRRSEGVLNSGEAAQRQHLATLYDQLVRPIRDVVTGTHLIVIPDGLLHRLPFHALIDGDRYLIDDYVFSYAPSLSALYECCKRSSNANNVSLVLGVPERKVPQMGEEIEAVAGVLPHATRCTGEGATEAVLRGVGASSRYIHLASHYRFRADNPLFSSVQLADTKLSVFDINQMKFQADLVTLSGCSTGVNGALQGDELAGMARGFLRAGARSVMMMLWDVHDRSTAEFMKLFYSQLTSGMSAARALRCAMVEHREQYASLYFWAPFVLSGGFAQKVEGAQL